MFKAINIDRKELTLMGVKFTDLETLEATANAIGSNMFEGFEPTPRGIEIIRDYVTSNITLNELIKLAEILDNINHLHPFREGNGRAQREFLRLLALENGLILNLNPPDNTRIYNRYMKGTIEGNTAVLSRLILELIEANP